jgi:hypothetical protein
VVSTAPQSPLPWPVSKEMGDQQNFAHIQWRRYENDGMAILQYDLPCISNHGRYIQRLIASDLQDKGRRNPLYQTSLSPHEAVGGRERTLS